MKKNYELQPFSAILMQHALGQPNNNELTAQHTFQLNGKTCNQ